MSYPDIKNIQSIIILIIPLVLTGITHLWNPIGFPTFHSDEAGYIARAMHVLEGHGPQESSFYDHPYFGQLFLAGIFYLIHYPAFLHPHPNDIHSIEMLYLVPRFLMGILALVDTFLVFKISEYEYNRRIALIASVLFAVMPITWLTRGIFLDSIYLPFVLLSILFGIYTKTKYKNQRNILLTSLSGICLGVAIFTKIPAYTFIPLVGFLIYTNSKNLRIFGLWFVPVVIIPFVWIAYAISVGELNQWLAGVALQTHRISQPLMDSLNGFYKDDPILLILGSTGLVFAALRKDTFLLLWSIPFLVFLSFIRYVSLFHLIPLLPVFCIAASVMIGDLLNRVCVKRIRQILYVSIISILGIFGFASSTMLISTNITSSQIEAATFVTNYLDRNSSIGRITIISNPFYFCIPQYIFHINHFYKSYDNKEPVRTARILLIIDHSLTDVMSGNDKQAKRLQNMYNSTNILVLIHENTTKYDFDKYPYTNIGEYPIEKQIEIRKNY